MSYDEKFAKIYVVKVCTKYIERQLELAKLKSCAETVVVGVVGALPLNVWSVEDHGVVTEVDMINQTTFNMGWVLYQLIKVLVF